ncbi:hypothetical protein N7528_003013 [Penicillium herquei]|nr:hypothetical protein N7528_003013 [Penicillium herquei]
MRFFFQTSKNQPPAIGLCAKGLIAETSYTVSFTGTKSHLTAEPIFACPHTDLMSLIRWRDVCKSCSHCRTWIERSPLVWGRTSPVGYKVTRCLGGYEQPAELSGIETQRYWEKNCRLTKSKFASYRDYWQSSYDLISSLQGVQAQWERDYCLEQERLLQLKMEGREKRSQRLRAIPAFRNNDCPAATVALMGATTTAKMAADLSVAASNSFVSTPC